MPVIHPSPPAGGTQLLLRQLRCSLHRHAGALFDRPDRAASVKLSICDPHRCYSVGLGEIIEGRFLSSVTPGSWRYFVLADGMAVADAYLADDGSGGLGQVSVHEGAMAASAIQALLMAEALPQIEKDDYELRTLQVPALHLVALWFRRSDDDIIIPTAPTPSRIALQRPYSETELRSRLDQVATAKKRAYEADTTGKLGG